MEQRALPPKTPESGSMSSLRNNGPCRRCSVNLTLSRRRFFIAAFRSLAEIVGKGLIGRSGRVRERFSLLPRIEA